MEMHREYQLVKIHYRAYTVISIEFYRKDRRDFLYGCSSKALLEKGHNENGSKKEFTRDI
jgi:hypothetical protein